MERSPRFIDRKKSIWENGYFTKSNLQIQTIPTKFPVTIFTEIEKNLKTHKKAQETPVANHEQKEYC